MRREIRYSCKEAGHVPCIQGSNLSSFFHLFLYHFNNPEGRELMHPKHRAHVLLPYTYTKSRASCFICDDFYKNFVAPLRMHLQRSRSTPDILKRVFNLLRRRPSFGAPEKGERGRRKKFLCRTESLVFVLLLFHLLEWTQIQHPFQREHPPLRKRPGANFCIQLPL